VCRLVSSIGRRISIGTQFSFSSSPARLLALRKACFPLGSVSGEVPKRVAFAQIPLRRCWLRNVTIKDALTRLLESESDYIEFIKERKFDLGLYRPVEIDPWVGAKGRGRSIARGQVVDTTSNAARSSPSAREAVRK